MRALLLASSLFAAAIVAPSTRQHLGGVSDPGQDWRATVLAVREAAWRDFFGNPDKLAAVLTDDFIGLGSDGPWRNRAETVDDSRGTVAAGTRLVRVTFPRTDFQRYGDVVIIYTTYELQLANGTEALPLQKGQATEFFVWTGTRWMHNGWHLQELKDR
jgi:hypothetical protein